jgi:leader peptidase (prepilin peptidase)/N-methyltransferase
VIVLVYALASALATHALWALVRGCAQRRRLALDAAPAYAYVLGSAGGALAALGGGAADAMAATAATVAGIADARSGAIFDPLTAALLVTAVGIRAAQGSVLVAAGGALACGGSLLLLHLVTRGSGLGRGDVKFGFALGAALGPASAVAALGAAFAGGAAYGLWLLARGRARRRTAIAFGPFLAAGTFAALLVQAAA